MPEIHSCISLIEQAAGLPFNLPTDVGDLTFQLCNMGGELVSVEGLAERIHPPTDLGLIDHAKGHAVEAWISLQQLMALG